MADWLAAMPPIPLARGVPVVEGQVRWTYLGNDGDDPGLGWVVHDVEKPTLILRGEIRVDLSDPQGFGYAMRWLRNKVGLVKDGRVVPRVLSGEELRWWFGQTTDADRLALAQACREVVE